MANEQNLKVLSPNEAREFGRIGGIMSGNVRRERKKLRETTLALLNTPVQIRTDQPFSKDNWFAKFDVQNPTIMNVILARLVNSAYNGDLRAIKLVLDIIDDNNKISAVGAITNQQISVSYRIDNSEFVL